MERWSIGLALPVGAKVRAAGRLTASGLPAASSTKQPSHLVGCHPSYRTRYQFNGRIRCDRPVVCARGRAESPIVTCLIESSRYAVVNVNTFDNVDKSEFVEAATDFEGETVENRLARRHHNWTPEAVGPRD